MKKTAAILLSLILLLACTVPAGAAHVSFSEASSSLESLGLLRGTGSGLEPQRVPDRDEALAMLIRLLGLENEAASYSGASPFADEKGGWAEKYVGLAWSRGLVTGVSDTSFAGESSVSVRDYLTMALRALGYADGTDFTWAESIAFSDSVGLTHGEYSDSSVFTREDMILVSYTALTLKLKGTDTVLVGQLYLDGAVSYSALVSTRLSGYVNTGRTAHTPEEIYELGSSSVFYLETYESDADYTADKPSKTASGFFITSDGVAVTCYHAIDGARRCRVTTSDGRRFEVTGVLWYDPLRDCAIMRISRTDVSGETVTRFPYLTVGDSASIGVGDAVYTISSPLGLSDSFSSGVVATKSRVVDDPAYPCIQSTAPISSGSSGGALLNAYGDAVGIDYGAFTKGDSLNLFVPISAVSGKSLTGDGETLAAVCDRMDALKAKATLKASVTEAVVSVGETVKISITTDYPSDYSLMLNVGNEDVATCAWGDTVSKSTNTLEVTGVGVGTTSVTIKFYKADSVVKDVSLKLPIRVISAK